LEGPVAIVGYMGSGKSTIGRILARRLGWQLLDLDHQVSRMEGRSIPEIFIHEGEEHFRDLESEALRYALSGPRERVVACGGGVVLRPENRELLKGAPTVFLEEDAEVLYGRTRTPGRPLRAASREEFEARYRERLPLYREVARLTVRADGRRPGRVAREVERWLRG
jgi:shikimate kinase